MAEHLDNLLAVHHFLNVALDLAERLLLAEEVLCRPAADVFGGLCHEENAEKHNQHERQREIQHEQQQTQYDDARGEQLRQALRDELAQRVDIIRVIAHDIAAAVLVKIADGELLHAGEHPRAHLVQKALRDVRHKLRIDGRADKANQIDADHGDERGKNLCADSVPAG